MMEEDQGAGATPLTGLVANVQRMSTEDGPGLRTTVFLKGCGLRCRWCHNPETRSPRPELLWHEWKCLGCGLCVEACPEHALVQGDGQVRIDREGCTMCGDCAAECPSTALEIIGVRWHVEDLVREVLKDRSYFEASGGGLTVSGGEPTLQPEFTAALLDGCRRAGVHTALDTCGFCSTSILGLLADRSDLVLYDVKLIDPERHASFTGRSNERILDNLHGLAATMRRGEGPHELWVRTPMVPGATATEENVREIGAFLAAELGDVVARWELCAFNNLARDKYRRMGLPWDFEQTELLTPCELERLAEGAARSGFDPARIVVTGPTAVGSAPGRDEIAERTEA